MSEALNIAKKSYRALERKQPAKVRFLGKEYSVNPGGEVSPAAAGDAPEKHKILILHYLLSGPGKREAGELIDFKQLPGGITYNPVFEGRVYGRIAGIFGEDHELFFSCGETLGGKTASHGDASMSFEVFPGAQVYVVLFSGDEEFKPACKILFDRSIEDYFPTEDIIIICEELGRALAEGAKQ
jgi:hypothetical protein